MPTLRLPWAFKSSSIWLVILLMQGAWGGVKADVSPTNPPYSALTLTTRDGLPQDGVFGLAQGPDGFLWVGTFSGVARYDGVRFENFHPGNTEGFPSAGIASMLASGDGSVWLGTSRGLHRLIPSRRRVQPELVLDAYSQHLVALGDEVMVAGPWGYAHGRAGAVAVSNTNLNITALAVLPGEALWMGTSTNLLRFPLPLSGPASPPQAVLKGTCGQSMVVHQGRLWLHLDKDLLQLDARSGEVLRRWPGVHADPRLVDAMGYVWLAGLDPEAASAWVPGLLDPMAGTFVPTRPDLGLREGFTNARLQDADGTLWFGTPTRGLVRMRPRRVTVFDESRGLPGREAWAVHGGPGLGVWATTGNAVARLAGDRFETVAAELPWGCQSLMALDRDTALVGGWGFNRVTAGQDPVKIPTITTHVSFVTTNRAGRPIAGGPGGAWVEAKPGEWVQQADLPKDARWFNWQEGPHGEVFAGSIGAGLHYRSKEGTWNPVPLPLEGSPKSAAVLWWEDGWRPWLGSVTGLYRLRDGDGLQWDHWTEAEGLKEDMVNGVQPDGLGRLWLLGHRGIHCVGISNLLDVARGKARRVYPETFDVKDGLPSNEGNSGRPSTTRDEAGNLWFATTGGLVRITPSEIPAPSRPRPFITDVHEVGNDALPRRIPHDDASVGEFTRGEGRNLRFRFTAPLPSDGQRVHLKYRLVGVSPGWVEAEASREATYAALRPGLYNFEVLASAEGGPWSDAPARWSFRIVPRWWEPLAVRVGALVLGVAGLCLLFWRRLRIQSELATLRQARAIEDERSRLARDMHDGLGSELARVNLAAAVGPIDAGAMSRDLLQRLQTLVWLTDPAEDRLDSLVRSLAARMERYFPNDPPAVHIDLPPIIPAQSIDANLRRELVAWLDEGLANIARHAQARNVRLAVRHEDRTLRVILADDGRGFDPARPRASAGGGHGLRNLNERIRSLGGQLVVRSAPGMGTELHASIPLPS